MYEDIIFPIYRRGIMPHKEFTATGHCPTGHRRMNMTKTAELLAILNEIEEITQDMPTMRALSALGAERATAKKLRIRELAATAKALMSEAE